MDISVVSTFLATMNKVTMNICNKFLHEHMFSILLGIYLEVKLLDHMVSLYIVKTKSKQHLNNMIPNTKNWKYVLE
jgi:hypothetical protein